MSILLPVPALSCRIVDASQPDMARGIDAYVMAHPDSTVFHRTAWNRATQQACGHKTHYIIAEDGDGRLAADDGNPLPPVRQCARFGRLRH